MQIKTDASAQKFDHRAITQYESMPARKLLARFDKLTKELEETQAFQTQLEADVAQLTKGLKLANPDKEAVEILNTKRLQVSMCPPRLEELEQQIEEAEDAIASEYDERLRPAVERLANAEAERVRSEIAAQLRPHCLSDSAARYQAVSTPRWQKAAPLILWHDSIFTPAVVKARKALDRLDRFNRTGDLEKESVETAANLTTPATA